MKNGASRKRGKLSVTEPHPQPHHEEILLFCFCNACMELRVVGLIGQVFTTELYSQPRFTTELYSQPHFRFFLPRQGFLCGPGHPQSQRFVCLCLLRAGVKGVHYHLAHFRISICLVSVRYFNGSQ